MGTRRTVLITGVALVTALVAGCSLDARYVVASPTTTANRPSQNPAPSPSLPVPTASPTTPAASPSDTSGATDPLAPTPTAGGAQDGGLIPVVRRIHTTDPVVFITIDDGFDKDPRVLDVLASRNIPVTPFLTTSALVTNPEFFASVKKITGQKVQDHTLTHPHLSRLGRAAQTREICDAADQLATLYGSRPWLFRPPYGEYDRTTRLAAASCGMTALVLWDVSLPHSVLRYASASVLQRGDIILIHWRPNLYRDINVAIDAAARQGLRVAALQEYLPR